MTPSERLELLHSPQGVELIVVVRWQDGRETEELAADVDEALALSGRFLRRAGVTEVEIFRIDPHTGGLKKTLGPESPLDN